VIACHSYLVSDGFLHRRKIKTMIGLALCILKLISVYLEIIWRR
jgi:hypothetical protein